MSAAEGHSNALLVVCFLASAASGDIFRGVELLDQDLDEDITVSGDVASGTFPFVAAVFNALGKFYTCSGAIVSKRHVLCAGYCVRRGTKEVDPFYISVLAGVVDMRDHSEDQWKCAESISRSSELYMGAPSVVLIKVTSPFFASYTTNVIPFRKDVFRKPAEKCKAVTWRFHDKLNRLTLKSLALKQYTIRVVSGERCRRANPGEPSIAAMGNLSFVCMYFVGEAIKSPAKGLECVGIDGSLIFCEEHSRYVPVGIASKFVGGSTCNRLDSLYIFFDVGAYGHWIQSEISRLK